MSAEAFITPELLRWARERDELSLEAAAERLHVEPSRLEAWEQGIARPRLRQARELAQRFNIPFGYLFLSSPPGEELPVPDLRTIADEPPLEPSADLSDLVNDVLLKQQWYREYQESERASPVEFIGRFSVSDEAQVIAADIQQTIGLTEELREAASTSEEYLRLLVRRAEESGVLVFRSGIVANNTRRKLNVAEFRGFAISDSLAPVIFINGQDAKTAQIFTLVHELAHLWLGSSGISNPRYGLSPGVQGNSLERLSNYVAAATLLPREEFFVEWDSADALDTKLRVVARRFRVSALVVLRRALDLGRLTAETYWAQFQRLSERQVTRTSHGEGGDFYATLFARASRTFTTALSIAVAEGRVLHRDAARLLNVRVATLDGIQERVLSGA